ncbi:MAG: hypothetical protein MJ228_03725 [Bacilli bacterium]|nr:hypothetical protein [Bacilli bacterium]
MDNMTPTKIEEVSKKKLTKGEIVFIILDGILALGGLTMIVLGFLADYFPGKPSDNWTGQSGFMSVMHLSYRWFGVILIVAAAIIAAFALHLFAKKNDTDNERALRRAQRLKIISESQKVDEEQAAIEAQSSEAKAIAE